MKSMVEDWEYKFIFRTLAVVTAWKVEWRVGEWVVQRSCGVGEDGEFGRDG